MSKIIRDENAGTAFADQLEGAGALREALLRAHPAALSNRDRRREQARIEGFEVGLAEGLTQGREEGSAEAFAKAKAELDQTNRAQIARMAQEIGALMEQFDQERADWFVHAEERLADLAVEIARRAVTTELQISREAITKIARDVLAEVTEGTRVRLRVNPLDAPALDARRSELESAFSQFDSIEVVADSGVRAGCKVEYDAGTIDARVEDFLARIVLQAREAS